MQICYTLSALKLYPPQITCISTLALRHHDALYDLFCCIHEDICTFGLPIVFLPFLISFQADIQCSSCPFGKSHQSCVDRLIAKVGHNLRSMASASRYLSNQAAVKSSYCSIKLLSIPTAVKPSCCQIKLLSNQAAVRSSYCQIKLLKGRLGCRLWAGWQRRGQPQSRP